MYNEATLVTHPLIVVIRNFKVQNNKWNTDKMAASLPLTQMLTICYNTNTIHKIQGWYILQKWSKDWCIKWLIFDWKMTNRWIILNSERDGSYLWDVVVVIVFLVQSQYAVYQWWQLSVELLLWQQVDCKPYGFSYSQADLWKQEDTLNSQWTNTIWTLILHIYSLNHYDMLWCVCVFVPTISILMWIFEVRRNYMHTYIHTYTRTHTYMHM